VNSVDFKLLDFISKIRRIRRTKQRQKIFSICGRFQLPIFTARCDASAVFAVMWAAVRENG